MSTWLMSLPPPNKWLSALLVSTSEHLGGKPFSVSPCSQSPSSKCSLLSCSGDKLTASEWGQVEMGSEILKAVMTLCPKSATSWAEGKVLQPHWSYGYISLLHPRPLVWSGTALRSEACRRGGKEENTLMAPCGTSGGLSTISRHQRGVEGALKEQGLSLFPGGREDCRQHEFFTWKWRLWWKSLPGIPLFPKLRRCKQGYSRQFCPIQSQDR